MKKGIREEVFKHHPKIGIWKKLVLGLPVLLSGAWIFYLGYGRQIGGGELLAPANPTPLIVALVLFTIGYIIFLLMIFSENIKEFFAVKQ